MNSIRLILTLGALSLLAACGGGGDNTPVASNTVTGIASAGIVKGGAVKVFKPYSSLSGADKKQLGAGATTSATGFYSVNIGSYAGPVIVEVTGGSYIDEAGNLTVSTGIPATAPLRAAVGSVSGTIAVAVTPLTELAVKQARKLGFANISTANAQISDLFKVDIIKTSPLDASVSISAGTQAEKDYTIALAAISQLAKSSSQTLDATLGTLATHISNTGRMDADTAASITAALTAFLADTTSNKTGVSTVSDNLKNIGKTTLKLTINLAGTGVKSVSTDILLPAGITVAADAAGVPLNGVLTPSIGGTKTFISGNAATPGLLRLLLENGDPSFVMKEGVIVTVAFELAPGAAIPDVTAFALNNTALFDINGALVNGTLTLH